MLGRAVRDDVVKPVSDGVKCFRVGHGGSLCCELTGECFVLLL
ncbi:MAG: hypothetical protein WB998_10155 [Solirubrobacteraceae bacterium]